MIRLIEGDARERLTELPDACVHCCVTSPPYYGLRNYGVDGQIGLETSPAEYVAELVAVFRELRRVLRDDGTLWLNIGDSYGAQQGRGFNTNAYTGGSNRVQQMQAQYGDVKIKTNLKPKDLIGIPWMLAFALRADGWWLRQDIIWAKPNPMPESVTDRCTKAHEYLFLLSKRERYWFDAAAIAESASENTHSRGSMMAKEGPEPGYVRSHVQSYANTVGRGAVLASRNRRSVWAIASEPFPEAHFATFPPALIEPCILAGCPQGGVVLDPFAGAGTTGLVCDRLQRSAILIELNAKYADMARRRIADDAGLFAQFAD